MSLLFLFKVERGTTATYLASGGANTAAFERLVEKRGETDAALGRLDKWLEADWFSGEDLSTREKFKTHLKNYRDMVNISNTIKNQN